MIVMKFGGTSVGSRRALLGVVSIVIDALERRPLVVVSAASCVTDMLLAAAHAAAEEGCVEEAWQRFAARQVGLLNELGLPSYFLDEELRQLQTLLGEMTEARKADARRLDAVLSFGERMSARVVAEFMRLHGIPATARMAWDMGMLTDANFGAARPVAETNDRIRDAWDVVGSQLVVTTGYIGRDVSGAVTTLGRGGSDLSASLFGAALDAEEIQIWTDVSGIMTSDPRVVKTARVLPTLPFAQAAELAMFGAKVLHPMTIEPAARGDIPVRVKNTFRPSDAGTLILSSVKGEKNGPVALAAQRKIHWINLKDISTMEPTAFLTYVMEVLSHHEIPLDMVATSQGSLSLATHASPVTLKAALSEVSPVARVAMHSDRSIICLVGHAIEHACGLAGFVFSAMGRAAVNVEMISQGASDTSIAFVVRDEDCEVAMNALHEALFEERGARIRPFQVLAQSTREVVHAGHCKSRARTTVRRKENSNRWPTSLSRG